MKYLCADSFKYSGTVVTFLLLNKDLMIFFFLNLIIHHLLFYSYLALSKNPCAEFCFSDVFYSFHR